MKKPENKIPLFKVFMSEDVKENIEAAEDKNVDWIIWNILSTYELDYFTKLESLVLKKKKKKSLNLFIRT